MPAHERPRIAPYRAKSDRRPRAHVESQVNRANFDGYSTDFAVGAGLEKMAMNPLFDYERLLRTLRAIPAVRFQTMEDLITGGGEHDDAVRVTIRHDVDSDVVTARAMAELEHAYGIPATYYILHTSPYYGEWRGQKYRRHAALAEVYREIQDLGHEIGLHTDGLLVYQDHLVDGAEAIVEELRWLRSEGLRIVGTAAHNHHTVYGAQNFEIFKGRVRNFVMPHGGDVPIVDEDEVFFNGKWAPLHQLDEGELHLRYEGHDTYNVEGYLGILSEIGYGIVNQTWNVRTDALARGMKQGPGDFAEMVEALGRVRPGDAIVFTTHPCFYGGRVRNDESPPLRDRQHTPTTSGPLEWTTYVPGTVVSDFSARGEVQTSQGISFANEFGVLSKPIPPDQDDAFKVLVFGGRVLEARETGVPGQMAARLEAELSRRLERRVICRSFAFPGMAVARYATWFEEVVAGLKPDVVLAGVGLDAYSGCHPDLWEDLAPGAQGRYLRWEPKTGQVVVARSDTVSTDRGPLARPTVLDVPEGIVIRGVPFPDHLVACIRHLAAKASAAGAHLMLLPEFDGALDGEPAPARAFAKWVGRVADDSGVDIVDVVEMLHEGHPAEPSFLPGGGWSSSAHRRVASAAADAIQASVAEPQAVVA